MNQQQLRALLFSIPILLALCLSAASAAEPHLAAHARQDTQYPGAPDGLTAKRVETTLHFPIVNAAENEQIPIPTFLIQPPDSAVDISTSPILEVMPAGEGSGLMEVTFYGRPAPVPNLGEDFTLIVLPDTQFYSRWLPSIYISQTQWIADNQADLNIPYTAHLGDIVNTAEDTSEWDNADAAMNLLENTLPGLPYGIPFGVVPGNHDYPTANYNDYFGVERFTDRDYYGGHFGNNNDNNYAFFSAAGMDFIAINLEFQPGTPVLDWADALLKSHPTRRGIVVSHSMLNIDNTWSFQGIFNELKDNPNLFLMLSGHMHSPDDGAALRAETGDQGNPIYVLMSNYQSYPNGGSGYLRRMRFAPLEKKILVQTYSPWLDAYLDDAENEFELAYDMTIQEEFQNLGTVSGVAPREHASITWGALELGTGYEWYAEVAEGASTTTSATWRFTTWSSPPICYALSLTSSGLGSLPTASPHNSYDCPAEEYQAGEKITLSGAEPDPGWYITGWTGTDDDTSLETNNTLTMPGYPHTASVVYANTTPPDTTITNAPPNPSGSADASFNFSSSEHQAAFECQIDGARFSKCESPHDYAGLEDGEHTFSARAVVHTGSHDPTPASHTWTIDSSPPDTTLARIPSEARSSANTGFSFSSSETGSTFECRLDSFAFKGCKSPQTFDELEYGAHSFAVRAVDRAGNPDPTPASVAWMVFRRTYFAIIIK